MNVVRKIEVFGDSILKGIQIHPQSKRYHVDNHIDFALLSDRFSLEIGNRARFGCTVTKGEAMLEKYLSGNPECSAIVMDFGGNDCDFDWTKVALDPEAPHLPHTQIGKFITIYTRMVQTVKERGIQPILLTLPPIDSHRFFNWFCKDLNKENILRFLGSISTIFRFQEYYSRAVEDIAKATGTLLIDLRGAFLKNRNFEDLLCEDGIHPNTDGQRVITDALVRFAESHPGLLRPALSC